MRAASPARGNKQEAHGSGRAPSRRGLSPMRVGRGNATPSKPGKDAANPATPAAGGALPADPQQRSPKDAGAPGVSESITVAVRIKPTEGAKTIMRFGPRSENALRFCHLDPGRTDDAKSFAYDHVFDQNDDQKEETSAH